MIFTNYRLVYFHYAWSLNCKMNDCEMNTSNRLLHTAWWAFVSCKK